MSEESVRNNKRIAKNTFYLYCRTIFIMLITLYTSRVILNTLGIIDFGIYNVIGGVVLMFSFLSNAMGAAVQRYISFELGIGVSQRLRRIFCMSVNIHILLALIIFVLTETIGLFVFYNYLNIPDERQFAALIVYQCSIISFVFTIIQIPYMSCVIAHEKMNIFAFVSIIDICAKLIAVCMLSFIEGDSLIWYAVLLLFIVIGVFLIYRIYTIRNFPECKYFKIWDKTLFKEMMSYSSWSLFGGIATVASMQGVNILLNIFFGPVVNAARGIAYQVNSAVCSLYSSFLQALNPQIVKQYSVGNIDYMHQMIFFGSRYTFLLILVFACPIFLETHMILSIWLGQVPDYAVVFCRLTLVATLIDCLSMPFGYAVQATGKIKKYQIAVGGILMLNLPISYCVLKITNKPEYCFYVAIFIGSLVSFARFYMCKVLITLSIKLFFRLVICKILPVLFLSLTACFIPLMYEESYFRLFASLVCCLSITSLSIYFFGMEKKERFFIYNKIKKQIKKHA